MDSRYETEGEFRKAVVAELRRQGLGRLEDHDWEQVKPDPVNYGLTHDQEDVHEVVTKLREMRPPERRSSKRALKARPRRRQNTHLYDGEERRLAEEASRLRASDRDVKDAAEAIWGDVWGTPAPPCSDSSAASSWLSGKVYVYQHTGGGLGGGPLLPLGTAMARLEYVGVLQVDSLLVPRDSQLGRLQQAADSISDRLNCFPHQAVEFLLTAKPPMVMPVTADLSQGRTTLNVNYPWVKPESVRRFHAMIINLRRRSAKRRLWVGLGTQQDADAQRITELGSRSRELLEFDISTRGLSGKERYITWNRKYPGRHRSKESLEVSMSKARHLLDGPEPFAFDEITLHMYEEEGYVRLPH